MLDAPHQPKDYFFYLVEPEAGSFALTIYVAVSFAASVDFWSRESFRFHVAMFFYLYITIGFACLTPKEREARKGDVRPWNKKYYRPQGAVEIFHYKAIRISPAPHVS